MFGELWVSSGRSFSSLDLSEANVPLSLAGHCYLMIDDLKKAYSSYQQALYYMPNPHVSFFILWKVSARPSSLVSGHLFDLVTIM